VWVRLYDTGQLLCEPTKRPERDARHTHIHAHTRGLKSEINFIQICTRFHEKTRFCMTISVTEQQQKTRDPSDGSGQENGSNHFSQKNRLFCEKIDFGFYTT